MLSLEKWQPAVRGLLAPAENIALSGVSGGNDVDTLLNWKMIERRRSSRAYISLSLSTALERTISCRTTDAKGSRQIV